jgi:DNA-binding transcriptional ArsR family regulator
MTDAITPLDFFKALAHESRLRIVGLTAQRAHSVQELARATGLTEPTASHHLAMLREAGLVSARADGTTHWYRFESEALRRMAKSFLSRDGVAGFADAPKGGGYDARVIKGFLLSNGRLKTFPASRKKRRVFCAWFARMFDPERDYREAEVNEVIARHHHDFETFRREMTGYRMFARTPKGVYRRLPETEWVEN